MMNKSFRQHADERLSHIGMSDAMKQAVSLRIRENQRGFRLNGHALKFMLAAALLLATATALALTGGFGLFELMGTVMPRFAIVRPEADTLVQRNLAHYRFEHVDVSIREAAYDGRYLRVAYAVTDRAATAPLDTLGISLVDGRTENYPFTAANQDGIWWTTLDWAEVNGQHINPVGMTLSVAGPNNGEAVTWVQFDVQELELPDTFTVRLPIRGSDTPHELDFTMDKSGMEHVFPLAPPPDKRVGNYLISIQDITVSPIRTYITLHLIIDPGVDMEEAWDIAGQWVTAATLSDADGKNPQQWADTGFGPVDNTEWVRIDLTDGKFDYEDRIIDPDKPVTMMVFFEFTPPEQYPDAFRLGHSEQDFILIPFTRLPAQ